MASLRPMNVHGRKVLLTGATGGLGGAIARALHARGARLLLTGRRTGVLEPLARELGAEAVAVDLAEPGDVQRLIERAGDVDVLVANAGLSASGPLAGFSPADIDRALDVNLRAPMVLSRELAEGMRARGAGHIAFVSSLSGMSGQPGASVYSASKFGLRGFAQALRAELRPAGVGVSTVLPGFVREAGMFHEAGARAPWYLGTSAPEAVAGAVVRAIERNRGEIVVAPPLTRVMTHVAAAAPQTAATFARLVGGDRITARIIADLTAGQRRE
jgi:short-subunit dehydrogenase